MLDTLSHHAVWSPAADSSCGSGGGDGDVDGNNDDGVVVVSKQLAVRAVDGAPSRGEHATRVIDERRVATPGAAKGIVLGAGVGVSAIADDKMRRRRKEGGGGGGRAPPQ